jgi:hypothetical protein
MAGAGGPCHSFGQDRIRLPYASRDRAPGARLLPICGMTLEPRTVTLQEETNPKLVVMTFSSVSVITNALRLNKLQL